MSVLPPPPLRWSVGEDGVTVEDLALRTAPAGALLAALSHSPKKMAPAPLDGGVPPPRLCLTPRTSEACLMEGIDPCVPFSPWRSLFLFAPRLMRARVTASRRVPLRRKKGAV